MPDPGDQSAFAFILRHRPEPPTTPACHAHPVKQACGPTDIEDDPENAIVRNGHLERGMHVMTKPFAMEALAKRIKELIADR